MTATFFRDPGNLWLALVMFAFALVADGIGLWAIVYFGVSRSNHRVISELTSALEQARQFPLRVAGQYEGVHRRLDEHEVRLRALEAPQKPRDRNAE